MAEEASLGVARLRQAITNQATCGSQFELSIDSADKLCREIEDELENLSWDEEELALLSWAKDVHAPVDADGEAVQLTTEVMYGEDGREYKGSSCRSFIWSRERGRWYFGVADGSHEVASLHLHRPDSWERLEEDAAKGTCDYFGCNSCLKCPSFNHASHSCDKARAQDIVRRAKALAERDVKEASRG